MKLELNIDSSQIGGTIVETFNLLTQEDRKELAKQVMLEWLREPHDIERQIKEQQVLEQTRAKMKEEYLAARSRGYGYGDNNPDNMNDQQIKDRSEYRVHFQSWRSTRERMIETVVQATLEHYKEAVTVLVCTDPQLEAKLEQVKAQTVNLFPQIVQSCLMQWFSSHMNDVAMQVGMMANQLSGVQSTLNMLTGK